MMTLDETAVAEFNKAVEESSDADYAHVIGDNYVALVLEKNGFPLLAAAYRKEKTDWWYA